MADASEITEFEKPKGMQPTSPDVPLSFVWRQFRRDIYDKEVQSAATYSYLWTADQAGHIAIGIVVQFALAALVKWGVGDTANLANILGFLIVAIGVSLWEWSAYNAKARTEKSKQFELDRVLLRKNAIIATAYMVFGALIGLAFHLEKDWAAVIAVSIVLLSVYYAIFWLRQKIVWQKAGMPYLARLATLRADVDRDAAAGINALVDTPPGVGEPRQVIIAGPVGSGRTPMVTGLGTDMAFKGYKVRYLAFDELLEIDHQFLGGYPTPPMGSQGPRNIWYWPWFESQVLLIDNVSPATGMGMSHKPGESLGTVLNQGLSLIRNQLTNRHTVWVFALDTEATEEVQQQLLVRYASEIQAFTNGSEPPIVVRLPRPDWLVAAQSAGKVRPDTPPSV